ncbi:hypothetical protein ACE15N_16845 [Xanthomonas campestris pv. passiflorae]
MKLILPLVFFYVLLIPMDGWAQGCPVGQYQIGGQGAVACAPIPQGNSIQQETRPSGKWIKTWGAIARDDDGGNLGVSTGALEKKKLGTMHLNSVKKKAKRNAKSLCLTKTSALR